MRIAMSCATCAALLAAPTVSAETATCTVLKTCDGAGNCKSGRDRIVFDLEPLKVSNSGEGKWRLNYNGRTARVEGASEYGPFLWAEGRNDIQSLMFSDDSHMLWHSARASGAVIRFMECEEG